MRYRYIGFDGIEVPSNVLNKKQHDGYVVVYQPSGCLWRITETINSVSTGLELKFWPSAKQETINWFNYKKSGLNMWYNIKGELDTVQHLTPNGKHGECFEYKNIYSRKFYYNNQDITNEVHSFVSNPDNLTNEDKFNLYIRYGSDFKFYEEYMYKHDIQDIIKLCSKML